MAGKASVFQVAETPLSSGISISKTILKYFMAATGNQEVATLASGWS